MATTSITSFWCSQQLTLLLLLVTAVFICYSMLCTAMVIVSSLFWLLNWCIYNDNNVNTELVLQHHWHSSSWPSHTVPITQHIIAMSASYIVLSESETWMLCCYGVKDFFCTFPLASLPRKAAQLNWNSSTMCRMVSICGRLLFSPIWPTIMGCTVRSSIVSHNCHQYSIAAS